MQMGVAVRRVDVPSTVGLARSLETPPRRGRIIGHGHDHRHPARGERERARSSTVCGPRAPRSAGSRLPCRSTARSSRHTPPSPRGCARDVLEREVAAAGLDVTAVPESAGADVTPARRPRIGVIEPWGGSIDAGWTRWVLEQHAFEYTRMRPAELTDPEFAARFDVIVIPEIPSLQLLRGLQGSQTRPEHRGGLEDRGVATLKQYRPRRRHHRHARQRRRVRHRPPGRARGHRLARRRRRHGVRAGHAAARGARARSSSGRRTSGAGRRDERAEQRLRAGPRRRRPAPDRAISRRAAGAERVRVRRSPAARSPGRLRRRHGPRARRRAWLPAAASRPDLGHVQVPVQRASSSRAPMRPPPIR